MKGHPPAFLRMQLLNQLRHYTYSFFLKYYWQVDLNITLKKKIKQKNIQNNIHYALRRYLGNYFSEFLDSMWPYLLSIQTSQVDIATVSLCSFSVT